MKPIDPSSQSMSSEPEASHPPVPETTADIPHQRTLDLSGAHERFLAERVQRAMRGRPGRCPRCGKQNPAGVTRHCSMCRVVRATEPIEPPPLHGEHRGTARAQDPDLDGVTRYIMEGGVLELRPDMAPAWVPAV